MRWPVIAIIIVVGLMIFSILWCCIRCACCGMSCCCTCFSFLKCCDCCGGSCDGRKNKPHKHLDDTYNPRDGPGGFAADKGYQAPVPMMGGAINTAGLLTSRDGPAIPQFAQFEVGKNGLYVERKAVSDDALPPMPSWETATKRQVAQEEKDAVELSNLEPTTSQNMLLMTGAISPARNQPPSPAVNFLTNPYEPAGQAMGGNGYMNVPPQSQSLANHQGGVNAGGGYRGGSSPGPGRGGPPRGAPGQMPGYGQPRGQDMNKGYGGAHEGNYGAPQHQDQYGNDEYMGAVVGDGYGRNQPQRQYSNNGNDNRGNLRPQPQTNYSSDSTRPLNPGRQNSDRSYNNYQDNGPPPRGPSRGPGPQQGPQRMMSPGPVNNGGFDFGNGSNAQQAPYSRPNPTPQQSYGQQSPPNRRPVPRSQPSADDYMNYDGATAPPSYASRSPPPQELGYPGYKPYTPPPPQQGGRAGGGIPEALSPGGRGREPRNWDPVR
jgi:hypothetical protein